MSSHGRKITRSAVGYAVLGVVAVVGVWKLVPVTDWVGALIDYVGAMGAFGYLGFVFAYVVLGCIGFPRTPLNVAAGVAFPFLTAFALVVCAGAVTYLVTFEIARHLTADWVRRQVHRVPNAARLLEAVQGQAFKLILLTRMNPFVPAVVKGYGFGTTGVPLPTYMAASIIGALPVSAAHVYLGWVGGEAIMGGGQGLSALERSIVIGGVVVSVALVAVVTWYAYRAIGQCVPAPGGSS